MVGAVQSQGLTPRVGDSAGRDRRHSGSRSGHRRASRVSVYCIDRLTRPLLRLAPSIALEPMTLDGAVVRTSRRSPSSYSASAVWRCDKQKASAPCQVPVESAPMTRDFDGVAYSVNRSAGVPVWTKFKSASGSTFRLPTVETPHPAQSRGAGNTIRFAFLIAPLA